jgi:gamma-glutamylputrescine oxidase
MPLDHAPSYYAATANDRRLRPALAGGLAVDVAIVGGGYTGLSAALELAERGYQVGLVEAERIGWGASGRNGGQINTGYRMGPGSLVARFGADWANRLWALGLEAKRLVRERIGRHAIDCDYRPGTLYAAVHDSDLPEIAADFEVKARVFGDSEGEVLDRQAMAERLGTRIYRGGFADVGGAHLHPLNYALGLARAAEAAGARIFEGSRATRVDRAGRFVETAAGRLEARQVLLCCNGYLGGLMAPLAARILPIANYIVATEPLGEAAARALIRDGVAVCDSKFVVNYYRCSADHRLLFGGGEVYTRRDPRDIKRFVRRRMLAVYPQLAGARIDFGWGGRLAITMNRLPHLGRLGPDLYFAHGYSGQGVALAGLAGKLMAEAIAGTAERFDVFARIPHRKFPGGRLLRYPAQVLGMLFYSLRDRL